MNRLEIGIDPGAQNDTGKVELAAELQPDIVRLNLIGPFDRQVPISLIRAYREIINAYRKKGIKVLGLVGAESVKDGYDSNNPEPFADKLALATYKVIHFFGGRLEALEILNEPNDYAGGNTHQVTPEVMALFLTRASEAAERRRQRAKIKLISGPLFSHDLYDNVWEDSGARYLYDLFYAGFNTYGWNQETLPFDQIGYHVYVAQGSTDPEIIRQGIVPNIAAIKWVLEEFQVDNHISVSEVGWQTEIVGEEGQADNIVVANDVFLADPQVARWLYFSLKDFDGYSWGLVTADGRKKPAFEVIAQLPRIKEQL